MPYANYYAARVKSPSAFSKIRTKKLGKGIMLYFGVLKSTGKTATQAYRFNKSKWNTKTVKAWLKSHKITPILFEKPAKTTETKIPSSQMRLLLEHYISEAIKDFRK